MNRYIFLSSLMIAILAVFVSVTCFTSRTEPAEAAVTATMATYPPTSAVTDSITESRRNALVMAIEKVSPAVVSVNVVQMQAERVRDPLSEDFWNLFFSRPRYMLRERRLNSVGSGFIMDREGHIVTNYHVMEDSESLASVRLTDGRVIEAELVGADERTDLAVLRAKEKNLPYVEMGQSSNLMIGEWVIAIGNPFGVLIKDPQPTATVGVVSANHRRVNRSVGRGERLYQDMIQTDAAINPGNSGGPLVNAAGQVVGVNTMIFSPSGGNIGLGFAIPIDRVRRVAAEIIQHGRRLDPWAGFKVEDVASLRRDFREQLGVRSEQGALVVNMLTTAPAYDAGLRPGDIITGANGQPVETAGDMDFALWDSFVGDTMSIEINRKGKTTTLQFPLKELAD